MRLRYKGVIFDLDGTLADTIEDIAASVNRALRARSYPEHPAGDYKAKVGWGIKRLAWLSLPEDVQRDKTLGEEISALIAADSAAFYGETPLAHSRPYPGIGEVLSSLRQMKIKTAVLTNKPDPVAQKVIAGLFPPGTFDIVRGEIMGGSRKPDPSCVWDLLLELNLSPADIIFTGDSEIDMESAVSAGCFPLGVEWGYRSRETILAGGARRIINKPEELLDFFIDKERI